MCQSPESGARQRYNQSFSSSIFAAPSSQQNPAFVPAGKRRDQTTSEMFGNYAEKDLRGCPKTFIPKDDMLSARQKKQMFLSSGVLPNSSYPLAPAGHGASAQPEQPAPGYEDDDSLVDTNMCRQRELQSTLFGRPTPACDVQQLHDRKNRLTPNDFSWHSHPEHVTGAQEAMSHDQRAYREKCSGIFEHTSPQVHEGHLEAMQAAKAQDKMGDDRRRQNVYYSDLFGRSAPGADDVKENKDEGSRRCKYTGNPEDKIVVHQDWTDSKTELIHGTRADRPEAPHLRKSGELHQARIFGESARAAWEPPEKLESVAHDNSHKLNSAFGKTTQEIHQAHLKSSLTGDKFYEDAHDTKHWEVVELHISGLRTDADNGYVKQLCQGFDLQLVKVAAEMDPVRNLCKGRAKVMVRYNPKRDSVAGLIQKLEESHLRVEL